MDYIKNKPDAILFLQKKLNDLTAENLLLKNGSTFLSDSSISKNSTRTTYNIKAEISRGEAYIDEVTGLVIGLNEINIDRKANVKITLPSKEEINPKVEAGKIYEFKSKTKNYILVITQVNYYSNRLTIQIKEK